MKPKPILVKLWPVSIPRILELDRLSGVRMDPDVIQVTTKFGDLLFVRREDVVPVYE